MNQEKKSHMKNRQRNIAILKRNRSLLKVTIVILAAGLSLSYLDKTNIGEPLVWLGVIIFVYSFFTGMIARLQLKSEK
jgi:putative Mn2+ efflux pump MntP